jgi:MoxR-like ATPase
MNERLNSLLRNLTTHLLGSESASELLVTGLLAGGHVLVQGSPGMGKTSLARVMAASIQTTFRRIQFTPDLLPSDIIGFNLYDQATSQFVLHEGPVFSNVILADEINRASPRTQSALLEAMQESQVTIDGTTHALARPFFVVATENHLSSMGTFPLPDSQLDRFLLSFEMPSPGKDTQATILASHASNALAAPVQAVMDGRELVEMQTRVHQIHVARSVLEYVVHLCSSIGAHRAFAAPPSTRASIALMNAARAWAFLQGRDAVYPDDIKRVFCPVFRHRLALKESLGRKDDRIETVLDEIKESTPVPMV